MEVSATKPEITIILSYKEAQRLRGLLWDHERGEYSIGSSPSRRLERALNDAGVKLP